MSEERNAVGSVQAAPTAKPSLWNQALRAVKGDSNAELVEQFTQEMTLVAEGLCEDQARLRRAVDGLIRQAESEHDRTARSGEELARQLAEQARETDRRLTELSRRLDEIERRQQEKRTKKSLLSGDTLGRLTLLAGMICGSAVLITLLKLFI